MTASWTLRLPSGCRWESPRVPDSRLIPKDMFPFATHPPSVFFFRFPFMEGLMGVGTVLGNKGIGISCVAPAVKK